MSSTLFVHVRQEFKARTGQDLAYLVWAITSFASPKKYGGPTIKWLSTNLTNSLGLEYNDATLNELSIWICKQPSHDILNWMPTFEHLEWKDLSYEAKTRENDDGDINELLSSASYTSFFHRDILFILQKPINERSRVQSHTPVSMGQF
jgi:chaperone BCS1